MALSDGHINIIIHQDPVRPGDWLTGALEVCYGDNESVPSALTLEVKGVATSSITHLPTHLEGAKKVTFTNSAQVYKCDICFNTNGAPSSSFNAAQEPHTLQQRTQTVPEQARMPFRCKLPDCLPPSMAATGDGMHATVSYVMEAKAPVAGSEPLIATAPFTVLAPAPPTRPVPAPLRPRAVDVAVGAMSGSSALVASLAACVTAESPGGGGSGGSGGGGAGRVTLVGRELGLSGVSQGDVVRFVAEVINTGGRAYQCLEAALHEEVTAFVNEHTCSHTTVLVRERLQRKGLVPPRSELSGPQQALQLDVTVPATTVPDMSIMVPRPLLNVRHYWTLELYKHADARKSSGACLSVDVTVYGPPAVSTVPPLLTPQSSVTQQHAGLLHAHVPAVQTDVGHTSANVHHHAGLLRVQQQHGGSTTGGSTAGSFTGGCAAPSPTASSSYHPAGGAASASASASASAYDIWDEHNRQQHLHQQQHQHQQHHLAGGSSYSSRPLTPRTPHTPASGTGSAVLAPLASD